MRGRSIEIHRIGDGDPLQFEVRIVEGTSETRHHVTMSRSLADRLAGGRHTPDQCVDAAFRFLLDREPKESILRRFDVAVIARYFPEFDQELPPYLDAP